MNVTKNPPRRRPPTTTDSIENENKNPVGRVLLVLYSRFVIHTTERETLVAIIIKTQILININEDGYDCAKF